MSDRNHELVRLEVAVFDMGSRWLIQAENLSSPDASLAMRRCAYELRERVQNQRRERASDGEDW